MLLFLLRFSYRADVLDVVSTKQLDKLGTAPRRRSKFDPDASRSDYYTHMAYSVFRVIEYDIVTRIVGRAMGDFHHLATELALNLQAVVVSHYVPLRVPFLKAMLPSEKTLCGLFDIYLRTLDAIYLHCIATVPARKFVELLCEKFDLLGIPSETQRVVLHHELPGLLKLIGDRCEVDFVKEVEQFLLKSTPAGMDEQHELLYRIFKDADNTTFDMCLRPDWYRVVGRVQDHFRPSAGPLCPMPNKAFLVICCLSSPGSSALIVVYRNAQAIETC